MTKQATVPEGADVLGLAGTAPGLVVEASGTPVIVLPGPPPELPRLAAVEKELPAEKETLRLTYRVFRLEEDR